MSISSVSLAFHNIVVFFLMINVAVSTVTGGIIGNELIKNFFSSNNLIEHFMILGDLENEMDTKTITAPSDPEIIKTALSETLKKYSPNEVGSIPVVMYHNLVEKEDEEGDYARTFENLKKDLILLLNEGYVPITMNEWIDGTFHVPAGKTPVVLTFDDGHPTDIQLDSNGKPTDKCVVGVMEAVKKEYPEFIPKATFYLNGPNAFGDHGYDSKKIAYLMEHGYEIANHTSGHPNISEIPLEQAREEILSQAKRLEEYTGEKSFNFAVPFGEKFDDYENKIRAGFLGEYIMKSSVNVGWSPSSSIYSVNFNSLDINRITCGGDDFELDFWIEDLKNNPEKRFISDGMAGVVTIPKSKLEEYDNSEKTKNIMLFLYDDETKEITFNERN